MTARWKGIAHPALYEMINRGPGAGASHEQTAYWQALTNELSQVDADLNKALTDLKATWQGAAADGANASMTPLQQWSGDATSGSGVMRASSEFQADYIARARAEMPPPIPVTTPQPSAWQMATAGAAMLTGNPGPALAVAAQAGDHEAQEAASDAAAQKAVDTMNSYESNSTWNRNTLGTFVAPPDVVIDTPPPRGDGSSNPNGPGGWNNGFAYNGSTTTTSGSIHTPPSPPGGTGSNNGPTPPGAGPNNSGGNPFPPGSPPGAVGTGGNGSTDPSNVVPAPPAPPPPLPNPPLPPGPPPGPPTTGPGWGPVPGLNPLSPNLPFGGGDSTRPGAPGAPGGRGAGGPGMPPGFGGMDADGRSSAQLGRGGVAGLGTAGVEGVVNRGGSGGVIGGGRGGGGMHGAPMGAGGRMAGEEDDEHSAPDYLLETTDVFGDDRMVSPAVIGENPNEVEK